MVAHRFFLDQRRGANLTEQALLELQLDTFSYQSLLAFANRVEYILKTIPVAHQPSEQTKFTWLFGRLKKCRLLQRHIDRIKDAHEGSLVRTWDWLFPKQKTLIAESELREDANETAIKDALSPSPNKQGNKTKEQKEKDRRNRDKGAVADPQISDTQPALPGKPKAPYQGTGKGKGQQPGAKAPGKGSPKGDKPKGGKGTKGTPNPPPPKASQSDNPKDPPTAKEKAPCLFFPKGTCNRGPNCPFAHVGPGGKAPKAGAASKAAVAATVAAVLPTSANGSSVGTSPYRHSSTRSSWCSVKSLFDRVLRCS